MQALEQALKVHQRPNAAGYRRKTAKVSDPEGQPITPMDQGPLWVNLEIEDRGGGGTGGVSPPQRIRGLAGRI